MEFIDLFEALYWGLYFILTAGIFCHRHWLKSHAKMVNSDKNLLLFEFQFPMPFFVHDKNDRQRVITWYIFSLSLLIGYILMNIHMGLVRLFYPPETIYYDAYLDDVCNRAFLVLLIACVISGLCVMLFGYYSYYYLRWYFPDLIPKKTDGGVYVDRCTCLRHRWVYFSLFLTLFFVMFHYFGVKHSYMTDTELVQHIYLTSDRYSYDDIDSLNIGKVYVNGSNFRNTSYVFVLRDGRTIGCGGDIIKNHSPSKIGEIIQFLENRGVAVHKQELKKEEVLIIIKDGGSWFLESIYPEYKATFHEFWDIENREVDIGINNQEKSQQSNNFLYDHKEEAESTKKLVRVLSSGIAFAAIFITVWLIYIKGYGDEDASHNNFTVHMPISIGVMGALSLALAVYCSFDLKKNDDGRLLLWTIIFVIIGFIFVLLPLKGIWNIEVDENEIRIIHLWHTWKTYYFHEFRNCEIRKEGIIVFANKGSKSTFKINAFMVGYWNFYQRIIRDNIPRTVVMR